ncbi:unnamed protein product, partial [Oppiella nova]
VHSPESYIVGGELAQITDFPWIASIGSYDHFCGGSIIDKRTVLTAAHCLKGETASELYVRVGSSKYASGGVKIPVQSFVSHSGYQPSISQANDIAIIKVSEDIPIDGKTIAAVNLPARDSDPKSGLDVNIAGWGDLRTGAPEWSPDLRRVTVHLVDRAECRGAYGTLVTEEMICAGVPEGGKDSCRGDSGGPLTQGSTQLGVISWGNKCALKGYPGVYVRLSLYLDWIEKNK